MIFLIFWLPLFSSSFLSLSLPFSLFIIIFIEFRESHLNESLVGFSNLGETRERQRLRSASALHGRSLVFFAISFFLSMEVKSKTLHFCCFVWGFETLKYWFLLIFVRVCENFSTLFWFLPKIKIKITSMFELDINGFCELGDEIDSSNYDAIIKFLRLGLILIKF